MARARTEPGPRSGRPTPGDETAEANESPDRRGGDEREATASVGEWRAKPGTRGSPFAFAVVCPRSAKRANPQLHSLRRGFARFVTADRHGCVQERSTTTGGMIHGMRRHRLSRPVVKGEHDVAPGLSVAAAAIRMCRRPRWEPATPPAASEVPLLAAEAVVPVPVGTTPKARGAVVGYRTRMKIERSRRASRMRARARHLARKSCVSFLPKP
ncbi:hypothetical protein SAMN05421770_10558 [Granulicella rosea]|uniref:Uncharacterized protein n=1 Tax=Granulicella rosea TaxID=474952 RepID=A0A239KMW7_9BACT|nr:hypothetical protein SAMN05421770_10551 [Granulicella rosea]SNT19150.1 hypothetical protein SAMN05421770_10558 [Granulicella rosea]